MVNEHEDLLFTREAAVTIRALRQGVQWKPEKAIAHLQKRQALGHLSAELSIEGYNEVIQGLVKDEAHRVYLYRFGSERYYAIRGVVSGVQWLVIATREGVMETAFPPDAIEEYLSTRKFVLIGTIQEVLA